MSSPTALHHPAYHRFRHRHLQHHRHRHRGGDGEGDSSPVLDDDGGGSSSSLMMMMMPVERHEESLEEAITSSTRSQRQAQMELYDYNQRKLTRRTLFVDLRGQQSMPAHDHHDHHDDDDDIQHEDEDDDEDNDGAVVVIEHDDEALTLLGNREERHRLLSSEDDEYDRTTTAAADRSSGGGGTYYYGATAPLPGSPSKPEMKPPSPLQRRRRCRCRFRVTGRDAIVGACRQVPAVAVVGLLILMTALPFGVAYFPVGWGGGGGGNSEPSSADDADADADVRGQFPLPGKEALGIRMCLFATIVGQIVLSVASNFEQSVAFQLIENVPFYHALAHTVTHEQGYGTDALATLFFLLGLSSVLLGCVFYVLGKWRLGKVLYFFPSHVLAGFIGGIGVFICATSVSVTTDVPFQFDLDGLRGLLDNLNLFGIVIGFEAALRCLMHILSDPGGNPKFPLLAPVFFCSIVPIFYAGLYAFRIDMETAERAGYFFPNPTKPVWDGTGDEMTREASSPSLYDSIFDGHVLDLFRVLDLRLISWRAVAKSLGTVASMASFSLIHAPINIPAYAVSIDVDADMNGELIAHGYANALSGLFGGLQTIQTYSVSALFYKSGGRGRLASLAVAAVSVVLFVVGPQIATYIPRCMAGTLLLHIGIDLMLEGIFDSYGSYDYLEYGGILLIALVMTTMGMTAALLAGIISAMSIYAVQSITNLDPIFKITSAATLRSSAGPRSQAALALLDDDVTGRARIMIVQLQGHIFFGNVVALTDTIKHTLDEKHKESDHINLPPLIVILDFTLVVGMDSSAAHSVAKLKSIMHKLFDIEVTIFVSGSHRDSFPCDYALAEALSSCEQDGDPALDFNDIATDAVPLSPAARVRTGSISVRRGSKSIQALMKLRRLPKNRVCDSMDKALQIAEEMLIARENPNLLEREQKALASRQHDSTEKLSEEQEKRLALQSLKELALASGGVPPTDNEGAKDFAAQILNRCHREEFYKDQIVWKQGDRSDSLKLLISGRLVAFLEGTDIVEIVKTGYTIGELGLVQGCPRLSTVMCVSEEAVTYTLSRESWESMVRDNPKCAFIITQIVVRYLSLRVQHVSNRIFETRCLPI